MARFDDEQDIYISRTRQGTRRDVYDDEPPLRETDRMRPVRASRPTTDPIQMQRTASGIQRKTQHSQPPRSSQHTRQRIEYERYGRVKPSHTDTHIPRIQRTQRPFHTDENPDIPKIRRASLFQDNRPSRHAPPLPPTTKSTTTAHIPIVELGADFADDTDEEEPFESQPHPTRSTRVIPSVSSDTSSLRPVRRPYTPPDDIEELPARRTYGARNIRVPHMASATYARRGRHERTAYTHRAYSFLDVVQNIRHNRPLLIFISIALVVLVLLPLLINSIMHSANSTSGMISDVGSGNQSGSGQSTVSKLPVDPHELVITSPDTDHPAPPVFATAAYLLDADTGATLYAYNPFLHLPMMSTTKLMTATLATERGNLDQRIAITGQIANDLNSLSADSSVMGIKKGETYTLRELLYGLLLASGNDAAIAIGDTIGGNLPNFVALMNQKAQQLGLRDTHYMNPHGLLAVNHYSSARDLAVLGRYAFSLPVIHQISGTRSFTITKTSDHAQHVLFNGNQFLWWYPGVDAGKPGWDGGSNFVQVVSVVRNGHHLIGVTMRTSDWWTDMRDLMNWGFNSFQWVSPAIVDKQSPIPYDYLWDYFSKDKQDATIPTANGGRYYIYTGYSISGPIMSYFDKQGGLKTFGYPTSLLNASSNNTIRQSFQHATIQCDAGSNRCGTV